MSAVSSSVQAEEAGIRLETAPVEAFSRSMYSKAVLCNRIGHCKTLNSFFNWRAKFKVNKLRGRVSQVDGRRFETTWIHPTIPLFGPGEIHLLFLGCWTDTISQAKSHRFVLEWSVTRKCIRLSPVGASGTFCLFHCCWINAISCTLVVNGGLFRCFHYTYIEVVNGAYNSLHSDGVKRITGTCYIRCELPKLHDIKCKYSFEDGPQHSTRNVLTHSHE